MKYGYARVWLGGKSESVDAQARQLTKAGAGAGRSSATCMWAEPRLTGRSFAV
jgi:hypothetical protein